MMSDVKEMLRSALGDTRSSGGDLERTMKRAEARERTRRVLAAAVAFVVFVGAGAALWFTFRPATHAATPGPSESPVAPTPTPTPTHEGWTSYSDSKYGFSVEYPP